MNLEDYRKWLKKYGNYEEAQADKVAELLINFHAPDSGDYLCQLFPRKVIHFEGGRLEFDLVIHLSWTGDNGHTYDRLIGVEFKETDTRKVVMQAIARRDLVDYMYIATRSVWLSGEELLDVFYYNIGWVVWFDEGPAQLVLPSRQNQQSYRDYLRCILEREAERVIGKLKEKKEAKLTYFVEV